MIYKHPVEIPKSYIYNNFEWTGKRVPCATPRIRGDTYPMTWAADGEIYLASGDPNWYYDDNGEVVTSDGYSRGFVEDSVYRRISGMSVEKITGPPENFELTRVNDMLGFTGGGGSGPKPCGMISVDGTLYLAVQNLLGNKPPRYREHSQHGSDASILASKDYGKTWSPDISPILMKMEAEQYDRVGYKNWMGWKTPPEARTEYEGWKPMFPGSLFGGPSFVQFGQDNRGALDEYVYAVSADHWDNGSEMRLGRVHKSKIQDAAEWEYALTEGKGDVSWHKGLEISKPVLTIEAHMSLPEMMYIPSVKKYLLLTWALHQDFGGDTGSELTILESNNMWGPFGLVYYEWMWYKQKAVCYCPRIPLKWFDYENLTGWLEFSGTWASQDYYYKPQIMPFTLELEKGGKS